MIIKTKGIVFNYMKYQEKSIILHTYTESDGMCSFIVNGLRSAKSKKTLGTLQPFSLIEMVAYVKSNQTLNRLTEWKSFHPTHQLHQNIYKSTIALFLSEILGKSLHMEPEPNPELFDYLVNSIIALDQIEKHIENFHLHFLLGLMPKLGFGIDDGNMIHQSMELEGIANDEATAHLINKLLHSNILDEIPATGQLRYHALETILTYFRHHNINTSQIKSLKVLHQVFA